jgi:hypothetical protein
MNKLGQLVKELSKTQQEAYRRVRPPAGSLPINPISEVVKQASKKTQTKVK